MLECRVIPPGAGGRQACRPLRVIEQTYDVSLVACLSRSHQTPNELPQPHVRAACGLLNTNPLPFRPSLKSSTVPDR